jgi:dolichol-phosphate mannosyltransferase
MTTTIDLVLNAYNEIESIEKDLIEIFSIKNSNNNIKNVIIVEDGSSDGTSEKLRELEQIYNFTLSQSKKRRGYSKALLTGINIASSEFIFFSDLGGKFNWDDINKLIEKIPNSDFVLGVRVNRTDPLYRRLLTLWYSKYIKIFYNIDSSDPDAGFRIYKKNLIKEIIDEPIFNSHLLNSEFTIKCISKKASYSEVKIQYINRKGKSRGLPLKIIPKVIISTIKNSFLIRKQIRNYGQ